MLSTNREKHSVLLSCPRHQEFSEATAVERPVAVPINALPGWDTIPLHSKLPMLKCPDNQVIFSKNKIGRTLEVKQQEFDTVCLGAKMNYNPLYDKHLSRFYANEKILKRLRENGEITQDNDVICNLKEFNEYRLPLQEMYIALISIERKRLNEEKRDRQLIAHAEKIAAKARKTMKQSTMIETGADLVLKNKAELTKQRLRWNQALQAKSQRKMQQIETMNQIRAVVLHQKKDMHQLKIKHRLDVGLDFQRKRLIALKKHLRFKSERMKQHMKLFEESVQSTAKEKAMLSWEAHLKSRAIKHQRVKAIVKEHNIAVKEWIKEHMEKYKRKWEAIQADIEKQSTRRHIKVRPKHKRIVRKIRRSLEKSDDDNLKHLTCRDIYDALHTAIDLESDESRQRYDNEDYIYKAARFILEDILAKFKKDLSGIECITYDLENRVRNVFHEVKQYVIKRATQIIITGVGISNQDRAKTEEKRFSIPSSRTKRYSLLRFVSFSSFSALIGNASYSLANGVIKMTAERQPTPPGSLTSVLMEPDNENDVVLTKHPTLCHLERDEQIFIEHLFIKFKRQLTVGVGRQVLAAIECHRRGKILDVRRELQEIDREFLVKIMTRSILSYAVNCCNFHSNILLCQHALAADIILMLQKGPLKPARDPRNIVQPHSRCTCALAPPFARYCRDF